MEDWETLQWDNADDAESAAYKRHLLESIAQHRPDLAKKLMPKINSMKVNIRKPSPEFKELAKDKMAQGGYHTGTKEIYLSPNVVNDLPTAEEEKIYSNEDFMERGRNKHEKTLNTLLHEFEHSQGAGHDEKDPIMQSATPTTDTNQLIRNRKNYIKSKLGKPKTGTHNHE
jgi:hypothetical protein